MGSDKYQSGEVFNKRKVTGYSTEHFKDNDQRVEKIWHESDNTKDRMSLQNSFEDQEKTDDGSCRKPATILKVLPQFLAIKYWLFPECENNLSNSLYIWTTEQT